jgi:hypothetical protein
MPNREQANVEPLVKEESIIEYVVEQRTRSGRTDAKPRVGRGGQTTGKAYKTDRPFLDRRLAIWGKAKASSLTLL